MAGIFLSYGRHDAAAAKTIAKALERAGHTVWWDPNIRGGAEFSQVIEEALNAADVVIVLWSAEAIKSPWVRDEASVGRDSGRLVPVAIDGTQPPMGFRQFQTIDLTNWNRASRMKSYAPLLEAVDQIVRQVPRGDPAPTSRRVHVLNRVPRPSIVTGGLALVLLAAAAIGWRFLQPGPSIPVVAVVPASASSTDSALATNLLTDLGSLWSAKVGSLQLTGQQRARTADLLFQIGDDSGGQRAGANLILLGGKHTNVLWSKSFEAENGNAAALKQQTAVTAARVLECTLEGLRPRARLPESILQQYLNACSLLEEERDHDPTPAIELLDQVTRKFPSFEPAWSKLLIAETSNYQALDAKDRRVAEPRLRRRIAEARKIDPQMPEAYLAEIELVPGVDFIEQEKLAELALKAKPDSVAALGARATIFSAVGRQSAAIEDTRRAADLDPLSPATRNAYVRTLAYSGRTAEAQQELAKAEKLWPGTSTIDQARYRLNLRSGDPKVALQLVEEGTVNAGLPEGRAALEAYLNARINPTSENVKTALSLVRASYKRSPGAFADIVQVLGEFHQTDELIKVLMDWNDKSEVPYFADILFRPGLADARADPRFMLVAKHFGLLAYWMKSGDWPDFCFQPDLPYDCKEEAAKIDRQ